MDEEEEVREAEGNQCVFALVQLLAVGVLMMLLRVDWLTYKRDKDGRRAVFGYDSRSRGGGQQSARVTIEKEKEKEED